MNRLNGKVAVVTGGNLMKIGTLGAGEVAQAFAIHLLKAGHEVLLSNSRGPSSLKQLVSKLGKSARAVTMDEAAQAPVVLLAVPWPKVEAVLGKLPDWEGRILIDATNHFLLPSRELADSKGRVSSEIVSELAPSVKVVKALNTLYTSNLAQNPKVGRGRRVTFISGDDKDAKSKVSNLLKGLGFAVIDLGSLSEGGRAQQVGNGLAGVDLVQFGDRQGHVESHSTQSSNSNKTPYERKMLMQAIRLTKYGKPEEGLRLAEIAEPGHPKSGQILIRVEYAPINDSDLLVASGRYAVQPELPSVVGNEGAGKVLAVGDGVQNVKVGDRVLIPHGVFSWAEKVLAPAEGAIVLPAEIDPQQAAMLSINPPAAALLLEEFVSLKPGDWIVQNAANSGVGRAYLLHDPGRPYSVCQVPPRFSRCARSSIPCARGGI